MATKPKKFNKFYKDAKIGENFTLNTTFEMEANNFLQPKIVRWYLITYSMNLNVKNTHQENLMVDAS